MSTEYIEQLLQNPEYHKFIESHIADDIHSLYLKTFNELSFDVKFAILQIECKQRIKNKLSEIYNNKYFLFPSILSTEQCTAETIAKFHSSLFNDKDSVLDMTAGLCIDTYYISKKVKHITAIEINPEIASISAYNMQKSSNNITVLNKDCTEYIKSCSVRYDAIFIDPARRGDNNKRLYGLNDCLPNIIELQKQLTNIAPILYIKASPMIDITQSIKDLSHKVSDIWVVGINNECKELLFKVDLHAKELITTTIHTLNYCNNGDINEYNSINDILQSKKSFCMPNVSNYIYEPNCCIMKAQIYNSLETSFQVSSLHKNSHLFISNKALSNFPGRRFIIEEIIPFKNKEIKDFRNRYPRINVSVRNFKLSTDELKKRLKVSDGGDKYLFGTTDMNNNAILIVCKKD